MVALALHGGIAVWLMLPEPLPEKPPEKPLRVSLLAVVAETTTSAEPTPPPPKPKPPVKPTPIPKPKHTPTPVAKPDLAPKPPLEKIEPPAPAPKTSPATPSPSLNTVATAKYEQLLVAWLERQKKYPRRAKRMRIEGSGQLRITIDRNGQTQTVSLAQATGNRLLDKAALDMVKRANPFPPMPKGDPRQTMEFIIPVVYALQ